MAATHKFTLSNERILDGDRFGLRQRLTAQEPAGLVPNYEVFVFTSAQGELLQRVATLSNLTPPAPGNASYVPPNPCDYVEFSVSHGVVASDLAGANTVTLRFRTTPSSNTPLPISWRALADVTAGTANPMVERSVAAVVSNKILRVSEPFWTPQASVYCEILLNGTLVGAGQSVSARRQITSMGTYRADRFYRTFDSVTSAVNEALLTANDLELLLSSLAKNGQSYMTQGNNPETILVTV